MIRISSPEQEIYDYFYSLSQQFGYETYDHLPMENESAPYPFVLVGDMQLIPDSTKTSLNGDVILTLDIWGNRKQRFTVSQMAERFFHAAIGHITTENYHFVGRANDQSKEITQDQSVPDTILNRAILTLDFSIL